MLLKILWVSMLLMAGTLQFTRAATMVLYGQNTSSFYEATPETASTLLYRPYYNPELENIIILNGMNASRFGTLMNCFLEAMLSASNSNPKNTIFWDWSDEAAVHDFSPVPENVVVSITYVAKVPSYVWTGIQLGKAMLSMAATGRFDLSRTLLLGQSMGSHAAGMAGIYIKSQGKTVSRICGCDPSYPYHIFPSLSKDCADFVYTIRTDPVTTKNDSMGKVDFWVNRYLFPTGVNKDEVQPGCPPRDDKILSKNSLCSHNRCFELLARSLTVEQKAYKIKDGIVIATSDIWDKVDVTATGDYEMNTTDFYQCLVYNNASNDS